MRGRTTFSVLMACACVCVSVGVTRAYFVRYLNVTAPVLLTNKRILQRYVQCFAGEGPCPPQARDIKKLLPELMSSSCSKCDVRLRQVFQRCTELLQDNYPKKWSKMVKLKATPNSI